MSYQKNTKIPISIVVITKNEASNIIRCLESVIQIASEIVLVDSFSSDITFELAKKFSLEYSGIDFNLIQTEWQGYSQTKNFGNAKAKHPWILSIDADEELDAELIASIKDTFDKDGIMDESAWFSFNRLTWYCGKWIKHCGWYPEYKIRIFNKNQVRWIGDFIHETMEHNTTSIKPILLRGHLKHYSFMSVAQHLKKVELFSTIASEESFAKGKKGSVLKMVFSPFVKFLSIYLIKLGFLDGIQGYWIAKISAFDKFLRESKLIFKVLEQK